MRVFVEIAQAGERQREIGPVGGGVLRGQRALHVGGLFEGGLGVGEAVRLQVEDAQVGER